MDHPLRSALLTTLAVLLTAAIATGCTEDQGSTEAFCAQVKEVPALETVLARFSETDRDVLDDRIDQARTAYDDLAEQAPEEISAETDQVVALVNAILDAVADHPTDPAKASAQLRKAMAEHKGIDADREKVADFAQDRCDVQLDATLTEGGASSSSSSSSSTTAPADGPSTTSTTTTTGG